MRKITEYLSTKLTKEEAEMVDALLYNYTSPYFKMSRSNFIRVLVEEAFKKLEL